MAITFNGFTLAFNQNIDLDFATSAPDATGLANGGLAGLGNHSGHIDGNIFNSTGIETDGWTSMPGSNGSIAQLANGNLVIASQDADNTILYQIIDGVTGNTVLASTDINDADSTDAAVAALTGGNFVIVNQDEIGAAGGDADIDVHIYNSAGGLVTAFSVDLSLDRDLDPSVTALSNGNFAVSWTRVIGGNSQIWYAIYNSAGGVVKVPTLLDSFGSVNQNSDIEATAGGFVIVYEDNGWGTGTNDITMATLNLAGDFQNFDNISNPTFINDGSNDEAPSVTELSNGALAVTYGNNVFADTDTILALVNASNGNVIQTANVTAGSSVVNDVADSVVTGYGTGQIAVFQTNLTTGTVDGAVYEIQNNYTGDGANDVFVATGYRDFVQGGAGDDQLFGVGGNDLLNGDDGNDILSGGDGNDTVNGGDGTDTLYGATGNDNLSGGNGIDTALGGSGNDTVSGGAQGDSLFGQAGIDTLNGGSGNDTMSGGDDADTLSGGDNADQLIGGNGDDILDGGFGNDTMTGGNNADTYVYLDDYQADTIQGFTNDVDTLNLDDGLWGGGLTAAQVLLNFAVQTSPGIVTFDFGFGEVLTVINGAGITVAQLENDITIV